MQPRGQAARCRACSLPAAAHAACPLPRSSAASCKHCTAFLCPTLPPCSFIGVTGRELNASWEERGAGAVFFLEQEMSDAVTGERLPSGCQSSVWACGHADTSTATVGGAVPQRASCCCGSEPTPCASCCCCIEPAPCGVTLLRLLCASSQRRHAAVGVARPPHSGVCAAGARQVRQQLSFWVFASACTVLRGVAPASVHPAGARQVRLQPA